MYVLVSPFATFEIVAVSDHGLVFEDAWQPQQPQQGSEKGTKTRKTAS